MTDKVVLLFICFICNYSIVHAECTLKDVLISWDNIKVVYTGQGTIDFISQQLRLKPLASNKDQETHAALVLLNKSPVSSNYRLQVNYQNISPLRKTNTNTWEVLWVFFGYKGPVTNKQTNYFIAKTNGIELGRAYNSVDQEFLLTKTESKIDYNLPIQLNLSVSNKEIEVILNNQTVVKGSYGIYQHLGQIGLYTEDAEVLITKIKYCQW